MSLHFFLIAVAVYFVVFSVTLTLLILLRPICRFLPHWYHFYKLKAKPFGFIMVEKCCWCGKPKDYSND